MKLTLVLLVGLAVAGHAEVVVYPAPEGVAPAPDFRVAADGRQVFVYDGKVAPFAQFSFSGRVRVTVTIDPEARLDARQEMEAWGRRYPAVPNTLPIQRLDIRPLRLGVKPAVRDREFTFELRAPANLCIEINGNLRRPLFLFAAPLETDVPRPGAKGVRYFAPGKVYDAGPIRLNSNETVYIAGGAVVRGSVVADQASNAKVRGRGVLDGSDHKMVPNPLVEIQRSKNIEVEGIVILNDRGWTVVPRHSDDLWFRGMKMIAWNNNSDGLDVVGCKRLHVIDSFFHNNDDCITLKATASMSGGDWGGGALGGAAGNQNVEDVEVRSSVFWNGRGGNALEIGFELQTEAVRNITFSDCDIIHVQDGASFSIHNGDWAAVENVRFENIRVEDSPDELMDLFIGLSIYSADAPRIYHRQNPQRKSLPADLRVLKSGAHSGQWIQLPEAEARAHGRNRGRIRGVVFRDIAVTGPEPSISRIRGYDAEHQVEDVTLENVTINGRPVRRAEDGRFDVRFATGVRFITR